MLRQLIALFKKDFLITASYRFAFFFNIFSAVTGLLVYFFIDRLFGGVMAGHLEEFGATYFSYVLLSVSFFGYVGAGINSFSSQISFEQTEGTLEHLLLSPVKITTLLLSMALWNMAFATLDVMVYIGLGVFLFKINFSNINIVSTAVVILLTILSFSSLGILSAGFVLLLKRGNPAGWIINSLEGLLGGVYFPVAVLPGFLQLLAKFLPITYAIRGMQLAVYRGYSLMELKTECAFLALFSVILMPLSVALFKKAFRRARLEGSLAQH